MNVQEFRNEITLDSIVEIKNKEFGVEEVVEFKTESGHLFQKIFLSDEKVIISNLEEELFILLEQIDLDVDEPFPKNIEFDLENFEFNNVEYAVVTEVNLGDFFSEGDSEGIWNYRSEYDKRIIIFSDSDTEERIDLYGEIIPEDEISIL